jgi:hypothetical protein
MSQRRFRRAVAPGLGIAVLLSGASVRAQDSNVLDAGFGAVRNKQRFLVSRLEKVLPAGKLARYVQLRNKLDLGVRCDLAQQIPLVP